MSLWKQMAGAVRGLTSSRYRAADQLLTAAARETQPHQELAYQVALHLAPRTAQPVVLVKQYLPASPENETALRKCAAHGPLAWLPQGQTAENYLVGQGAETALEIHVLSAALTGQDGVNPPLALSV